MGPENRGRRWWLWWLRLGRGLMHFAGGSLPFQNLLPLHPHTTTSKHQEANLWPKGAPGPAHPQLVPGAGKGCMILMNSALELLPALGRCQN